MAAARFGASRCARGFRDWLLSLHLAWTILFLLAAILCAEAVAPFAPIGAIVITALGLSVVGMSAIANLVERQEAARLSLNATEESISALREMLHAEDPGARRIASRALRRIFRRRGGPQKPAAAS